MAKIIQIFRGWIRNFTFFLPKNLKLFGLITLRLIRDTYKLLFRYYLTFIVSPIFFILLGLFFPSFLLLRSFVLLFAWFYILYGVLVIARPSTQKKDNLYLKFYDLNKFFWQEKIGWIKQYQWMIAVLFAFMVILYWPVAYFSCWMSYIIALSTDGWLCSPKIIIAAFQTVLSLLGGPFVIYSFLIKDFGFMANQVFSTGLLLPYLYDQSMALLAPFFIAISPVFIYATLFLLDSGMAKKTKKDSLFSYIFNAIKMVFYNIPIFIVCQIMTYVLLIGFYSFAHLHPYCVYLCPFFAFILFPVILCFYTNLYIKYSYEQVALYRLGPK